MSASLAVAIKNATHFRIVSPDAPSLLNLSSNWRVVDLFNSKSFAKRKGYDLMRTCRKAFCRSVPTVPTILTNSSAGVPLMPISRKYLSAARSWDAVAPDIEPITLRSIRAGIATRSPSRKLRKVRCETYGGARLLPSARCTGRPLLTFTSALPNLRR